MGDKKPCHIRRNKQKSSHRISANEFIPNYDENSPLFSLQRIQERSQYSFSALTKEDNASFSEAIYKRRNISWKELKQTSRHGLGFEKISRDAITSPIPPFITDDVAHFLAFRYSGKKPMVGYRQRDVFFVLWFDHDYTLYKH